MLLSFKSSEGCQLGRNALKYLGLMLELSFLIFGSSEVRRRGQLEGQSESYEPEV